MARIIPNANTWIGFYPSTTGTISTITAPTVAQVNAAINLTPFVISLNASAQGNTVPTPSFDTLFETTIVGTSQATFTGDFYRDSTTDSAWAALARTTNGWFIISRFGGGGTYKEPNVATNKCEVWPVTVTSRAMTNMANNAVMTFTVNCAVTAAPAESAATVA
jgi:hypothetical protein